MSAPVTSDMREPPQDRILPLAIELQVEFISNPHTDDVFHLTERFLEAGPLFSVKSYATVDEYFARRLFIEFVFVGFQHQLAELFGGAATQVIVAGVLVVPRAYCALKNNAI